MSSEIEKFRGGVVVVTGSAIRRGVAHFFEQGPECPGVSVYMANNVVAHFSYTIPVRDYSVSKVVRSNHMPD